MTTINSFSGRLILALLFLITGCATVKEARFAQRDENRLPGERTVTPEEAGLEPGSPVSLSELETVALACNPSVLQAEKNVESARLSLKDVKADYLPTVSGSLGYEQATGNENRHNQSFSSSGKYSSDITVDLLLYDFGKTRSKVKQAVSKLAASEKDARQTRNETVYNVRYAFFQIKQNKELYKVSEDAVTQYKEHLEQMRRRFELGRGTSYDLSKAEVDLDNAVLDQLSASSNLQVAEANLNLALGFAQSVQFQLGEGALTNHTQTVDELMEIARLQEPGLAALRLTAEAASNYVNQTVSELYPTLSLNLDAALSGESLDLPWLWNLTGAGTLTQTLFDGGKNLTEIRRAVVQLQIARSEVASYEQTLYYKLQEALSTSLTAAKQYDVAVSTERAARKNLENVTEQFNLGKASSVDRTDAQVSYSDAQAKVITTRYDDLMAQAKLTYLIGE